MNHTDAIEAAADRMEHAINYLTVQEKAEWAVRAYLTARADGCEHKYHFSMVDCEHDFAAALLEDFEVSDER